MVTLLSRNLLWLVTSLSTAAFFFAYIQGWNLETTVLASTVATLLLAISLERVMPYRATWNSNNGDAKTDITSALVLVALVDPLLKLLAPLAIIAIYAATDWQPVQALQNPPLIVQILLVTLLIEFGRYWSHRLHHAVKPLWWLHAMHHSSERLYAINNLRFHPVNYAINFTIGVLPAMLLGFSAEALFGYLAITQPVLMLQHANLNLKSGWLNYLFSTNELHRWHHSTQTGEANSNYGNAIILWDQVFRTFRYEPARNNAPDSVGLFSSSSDYPTSANYFQQLASIRRANCCR